MPQPISMAEISRKQETSANKRDKTKKADQRARQCQEFVGGSKPFDPKVNGPHRERAAENCKVSEIRTNAT